MASFVEVQLGENRPVIVCDMGDVSCDRDDYVVLDVDKTSEFGRVISDAGRGCKTKADGVTSKIVRKATEGDLRQIENNRLKAKDTISTVLRKINENKLEMQIVDAEFTFDCTKIIFFFVAEGRVDFRNLVKDLAKIFRVRIELKQIGVRDRAKIVNGHGVCGRELCCSSFLKSFHSLSIKMAKEQGLPLNPTRISGVCGRIKCCMAYEFEVYREFSRSLPRVGDKYTVPEGKGKVLEVNILKRLVSVDLGEGRVVKVVVPKPEGNVVITDRDDNDDADEVLDESLLKDN